MRRTIVGSLPRRRALPVGREAIERAIRHAMLWRCPTPGDASMRAFAKPAPFNHLAPSASASWLPAYYRGMTAEQLRAELAALRGAP